MTGEEIVKMIIGAVVGGAGIVGLLFFFLRRYIEKRLVATEASQKRRRDLRMRRMKSDSELHHCYGRMHFWEYRFIKTGEHNGELESSFKKLEEAEAHAKELDREIIADAELDE